MNIEKAVSEMQVPFNYDHITISLTHIYDVYVHIIYKIMFLLKYFNAKEAQHSAGGTKQ